MITDNATGEDHGDPLRDNAYEDDGYRFHDILHFAFAVHLGWSPVWRKLLRSGGKIAKRPTTIDDAEDGGRAQIIEEAIVATAYVYADKHSFMDGAAAVDWQLLRHIKQMTANLEVKDRTTWEWNRSLMDGFRVWRKLREHNGGTVIGDNPGGFRCEIIRAIKQIPADALSPKVGSSAEGDAAVADTIAAGSIDGQVSDTNRVGREG